MAETKVRFGILGCANIARKVSRAMKLAPNCAITAIGSRSIEKASQFAAENEFPASAKVYGSYDAVLDDPDVEAVYIPLPTSLHLRWAVLAAEKKKHVLLEKPVALNVKELDTILEACESNGVQYMDATMWMHHPRTAKMREFLSDPQRFGQLKSVHSIFSYVGGPEFLKDDIRIKPDLDALGALGDTGWYCTRAILWANEYELPKTVTALPEPEYNEAVIRNDLTRILGCATIARKVSRAMKLAPNCNISAIGSRSIENASKFATENGFPATAKVYGSYDAVLNDPDVDAVYIPLPTSLHLRWVVLAAKKKKHVLLEKPVALNVKELDAILKACESNGVQYMDATMWMHHPRTAKMREFLSDPQRFGQLKSVIWSRAYFFSLIFDFVI
ncbi:unnamed protein product [Ilex paraguariensis]|uniref:Gfo/Idh/MocA-like oxidoreductase N-terminal domain-containing protein n=1 Tax=Ilex paraguariensis TaxID=185542 RepID=A0ABC8TXH7_9AQUA